MTNPLYEIPHVDKTMADQVPEHLRGGLARYVLHGVMPGGFLRAALANDFMRATNQYGGDPAELRKVSQFLSNEVPIQAMGGQHALQAW